MLWFGVICLVGSALADPIEYVARSRLNFDPIIDYEKIAIIPEAPKLDPLPISGKVIFADGLNTETRKVIFQEFTKPMFVRVRTPVIRSTISDFFSSFGLTNVNFPFISWPFSFTWPSFFPQPSKPAVVEPSSPPVVAPEPAPTVVAPEPAPTVVEPQPEPTVVAPEPAPTVVAPESEPTAVAPDPAPATGAKYELYEKK